MIKAPHPTGVPATISWARRPLARLLASAGLMLLLLQAPAAVRAHDTVTLQLKWYHQFQFAGYYTALAKGFYNQANLEVTIKEGGIGIDPIEQVLSGKAEFGVAGAELLLNQMQGKRLTALAAIFQHSPSIILSKRSAGIRSPHDLIGRRVMMDHRGEIDLWAMLRDEGIREEEMERVEASWDIQNLINDKIDATAAYLTNTPFFLQSRGIPYNMLRPRTYGVDFYGDSLFTSEKYANQHRDIAARFREASIKGWEYAMDHPDEILDLILNAYHCSKTRDHLKYEAAAMKELILPGLVQMGHMNRGRWEHMAETYAALGLVPSGSRLDGFLFVPNAGPDLSWLYWFLTALTGGVLVILIYTAWLRQARVRLQEAVGARTAELQHLNLELTAEIAERKAIEQALRESEAKYRHLVDNFPNGAVITFDNDLRYRFAGGMGLTEVGLQPEMLIGKTPAEVFPEDISRIVEQAFRETLAGKAVAVEVQYEGRTYEQRSLPLRIPDGEGFLAMAITQDITQRKSYEAELARHREGLEELVRERTARLEALNRSLLMEIDERIAAEEALRMSEDRFRQVVENIEEVFWLTTGGDTLRLLYVSPAFEKVFGAKPDPIYKDFGDWPMVTHPDDDLWVKPMFRAFVRGEGEYNVEYRIIRPDGEERWIWARGQALRDASGKVVRTVGVVQDITERKLTTNALREVEERFRQFAENVSDLFWIRDLDSDQLLYISPAYESIWGRSIEELYENSQAFIESILPDDRDRVIASFELQKKGAKWFDEEYRILRPNGEIRWIWARNWPVYDDDGRLFRIIGLAEDITARKAAEEGLIKAKEAAESANRAKTEFLANISHEFRTPLNPIIGLTEVVLDTTLTLEQRAYLTDVRRSAERLLDMINDLIELSRLEAGQLKPTHQPFSLKSAIRSVMNQLEAAARLKKLNMTSSIAPSVPHLLYGDAMFLTRILNKLCGNAIKFTEKGEVGLTVGVDSSEGRTVRLRFQVRDTGPGIPKEHLQRLFVDFSQVDGSSTRRFRGIGLGLSLTRRLVEHLNGSLEVSSVEGEGSVFSVHLPFTELDLDAEDMLL